MADAIVTTLRLPKSLVDRADKLALELADDEESIALGRMSRSVVLRLAVLRGLEVLENGGVSQTRKGQQGRSRR